MKIKHIFIFSLVALLFFSCNPNKAIYEQLDAAKKPYSETFTYKLTDADYSKISKLGIANATTDEETALAKDLATFKTFSVTRKTSDLIPAFLASAFIALDSGSSIIVEYNYTHQFTFAPNQKILLSPIFTNFADVAIELANQVADPLLGDMILVTYNFEDGLKAVTQKKALFKFDGTNWINPADSYILQTDDYNAFGTDVGQPGADDYFSATISADYYLPTYLKAKYPYAAIGQTAEFVYKFNNSGIYYMYDIYTFDGENWNNIELKSDPFINSGTAWVFDPTVVYSMATLDYQILVDWVKDQDTISAYYDDYYKNAEYYFGATSYYGGEFNFQLTKRFANDPNGIFDGLTSEESKALMYEKAADGVKIFLELKFPDAEPFSHGVPVYYKIYFVGYDPPASKYMVKFLCTDVGEFEYVEGPTIQ